LAFVVMAAAIAEAAAAGDASLSSTGVRQLLGSDKRGGKRLGTEATGALAGT